MTSRERVLKALNHQEPDKVPIDFGSMRSTGIMAVAYHRLKEKLGITTGVTRIYDWMQQLAEVEKEIIDLFEVDVVDLENTSICPDRRRWKKWTLPDGSPAEIPSALNLRRQKNAWVVKDKRGKIIAQMPDGSYYFTRCEHPLEKSKYPKDIRKYKFYIYTDQELERLHRRAQWLYRYTNYAIMGGFGGNILESGQGLRGWEQFMIDLASDRVFAEELMDRLVETHLINLRDYLAAVGDYIQIIQMGDDLGTQISSQISPQMYAELIKPRHKKIYQYVREHSQVKVFLHSCGAIYDLIPDLIDAGVDILNPVQTSAAKMDPKKLKERFGTQVSFWGGGCDTQSILTSTPKQIEHHVKERIKIFAPGGGFVFCQVHNIQANVPPENIIAMFEAVKKYRTYPIRL
ncbi:MAG: methyltransferase [bacterium]|nr:methyltransferase [bacterium]